jgi:HEAT repeat protein
MGAILITLHRALGRQARSGRKAETMMGIRGNRRKRVLAGCATAFVIAGSIAVCSWEFLQVRWCLYQIQSGDLHAAFAVTPRLAAAMKPSTVQSLLDLLRHGHQNDRRRIAKEGASEALLRRIDLSLTALLAAVKSDDEELRAGACRVLGDAVFYLELDVPEAWMQKLREEMKRALGTQGRDLIVQALRDALGDPCVDVRFLAARGLAGAVSIGDDATQALLGVMDDPDIMVQRAVMVALGGGHGFTPEAMVRIAERLCSDDRELQRIAASALGHLIVDWLALEEILVAGGRHLDADSPGCLSAVRAVVERLELRGGLDIADGTETDNPDERNRRIYQSMRAWDLWIEIHEHD